MLCSHLHASLQTACAADAKVPLLVQQQADISLTHHVKCNRQHCGTAPWINAVLYPVGTCHGERWWTRNAGEVLCNADMYPTAHIYLSLKIQATLINIITLYVYNSFTSPYLCHNDGTSSIPRRSYSDDCSDMNRGFIPYEYFPSDTHSCR